MPWKCHWEIPQWVPGGKWIAYDRKTVMLRRAARYKCVFVAGSLMLGIPATVPTAIASPSPDWPTSGIDNNGISLPGGIEEINLPGGFTDVFIPSYGMIAVPPGFTFIDVPACLPPSSLIYCISKNPDGSVPEPASLAILGFGIFGLSFVERRRIKSWKSMVTKSSLMPTLQEPTFMEPTL